MKLSEAKLNEVKSIGSIGKKIILGTFCLILFLIFTALSYGDIDPKYKARAHPWSDMVLSPGNDTPVVDVLMFSIGPNTILTFTLNRITSTTKNIDHSNINREKWIKATKDSPKRLPQR